MTNKKYFYGVEVTQEEIDEGFINYRTLAKAFDAVLCNDITKLFYTVIGGEYNELELINGSDYDEDSDKYKDIYQYYIIDYEGYNILKYNTDEIIYYIPVLDIYVWGITHFGTPWDSVYTDIKIDW
jgi:hypothetical protein